MKIDKITEKTAISILNSARPRKGSYERLQKAFDMAIKALEKQIPKKVNNREEHADYIEGNCPDCDLPVCDVDNYCSKCGCLLEWSE